ncbi:MAG: YccF domain-containing protein [Acholeplasmataceae bacterium]|nr:YccF domain-containing protein [Acholeplasmataceae bacterium]
MKLLGNIVWLVFGGLIAALIWFVLGVLLSITIIGLPIGMQFFKFSKLMLMPFGKEVKTEFDKHPIANILWLIFFGWETALGYVAFAILSAITIIGIPFTFQWLKLTQLALFPFGAKIKS